MKQFTETESGLSHPHLPLAVRLGDDGFVYIQAGDSAGIVLDSKSGAVTVYGSSINFIAPDLMIDGQPVNKEGIIQRAVGKVRALFSQAVPKFPAPKE